MDRFTLSRAETRRLDDTISAGLDRAARYESLARAHALAVRRPCPASACSRSGSVPAVISRRSAGPSGPGDWPSGIHLAGHARPD